MRSTGHPEGADAEQGPGCRLPGPIPRPLSSDSCCLQFPTSVNTSAFSSSVKMRLS